MLDTIPETKTRSFRGRRSPGDRLREALTQLAAGNGTLITHQETAWASITFSGTRHEMVFEFEGPQAVVSGELFAAILPDHEFTVPGQLVADALVTGIDHKTFPQPKMTVSVTVLMLVDA
ncbi:MAG: hypothetical protein ABJP34_00650 [Erythrobacter sp.]